MAREKSGTGWGAILRATCLFVVGFFLATAAIHPFVRDSLGLYASERSEKLEMERRNHFQYSSAAFGSSHVEVGFDPRAFDAGLAGTSLAVHSFNLGLSGGAQVEQRVMALDFLDHLKPPPAGQPCFVLLEATAPPTFSLLFTTHPRQINILDWRSEELARQFPEPQTTRLHILHLREAALEPAIYHLISMGMLSNRIFRPPYDEAMIAEKTKNDHRGLHVVPETALADKDVDRSFALALPVPQPVASGLEEGHRMLIEELERAPHGNKVQFVWVAFPELDDLMQYKVLPDSEMTPLGEVPILNLARPDLYPQLYEHAMWRDNQHLNEQGAKAASALLAKLLLNWSHDHPVQRNCGG